MDLITLLLYLIVIGVVLYLINIYILPALPISQPFKTAIMAIIALIIILWLLSVAGLLGPLHLRTGWRAGEVSHLHLLAHDTRAAR